MTAADALGMIAGQGAEQVAVTALRVLAWPAVALAVALPLLAAWRYFRYRRDRAARWAELRPEPEIGDDVIAMIRRAREDDRTEAQADADYERAIDEMIEKWGLGD